MLLLLSNQIIQLLNQNLHIFYLLINMQHFQHLELSDANYYKPSPIDMIIGSDYSPLKNLKCVLSITENGLEAREAYFGP